MITPHQVGLVLAGMLLAIGGGCFLGILARAVQSQHRSLSDMDIILIIPAIMIGAAIFAAGVMIGLETSKHWFGN